MSLPAAHTWTEVTASSERVRKGKGIGRRTIVAALVRPRPGRAFWFRMAAAACWHGRDEENTRWGVLRASRGQVGDVVLPYLWH